MKNIDNDLKNQYYNDYIEESGSGCINWIIAIAILTIMVILGEIFNSMDLL